MIGSGMNSAAVAWYILQATHSTIALGTFAVVQTLPAILLLPFTGVIIDREDRRRLVMMLDAARAVVILVVAILAFVGRVKVWELYAMNMLVAAGFWMFWPTITALIQELTPEGEFVHANTFLAGGSAGRMAHRRCHCRIRVQQNRPGRSPARRLQHLRRFFSLLFRRAQGTPRSPAPGRVARRHRGRRDRHSRNSSANFAKACNSSAAIAKS